MSANATALLTMDCQSMMVNGYTAEPAAYLARASRTIEEARKSGVLVIMVRLGFRPGYPEVHDNNGMFAGVRDGGLLVRDSELAEFPAEIAPQPGDIVIEKHRVSAFEGTDLDMILRSRKINTLVMFGIATSGCVLSTVRRGADLDYRMTVIGDLCADGDAAVHDVLLERIFPAQASVLTAEAYIAQL